MPLNWYTTRIKVHHLSAGHLELNSRDRWDIKSTAAMMVVPVVLYLYRTRNGL